jgi:hypothetical protein
VILHECDNPIDLTDILSRIGPGIVLVDGPHGSGKSTLIETLRATLPKPRVYKTWRSLGGTARGCTLFPSLPISQALIFITDFIVQEGEPRWTLCDRSPVSCHAYESTGRFVSSSEPIADRMVAYYRMLDRAHVFVSVTHILIEAPEGAGQAALMAGRPWQPNEPATFRRAFDLIPPGIGPKIIYRRP